MGGANLKVELKKEFYTTHEIAELFDIGYYAIYRKVKKGEIPAVKVGRRWRIPKQALLDYINQNANI